ncbi:GNAT family N-acetyltransferase [Salinicola sp. CR57]|uniref:GNAT family N-acetyltransferase n=1 Tax=Salinicola sp. CR57 TaxID=1949086 RepID=UPI000DA14567|nr:GNAT family N-acetyltransferase [Salinicola sp. CR57]
MADARWRPALPTDLVRIAEWIGSAQALEHWAGPGLSWPTDGPRLWREIDGGGLLSFCLVSGSEPLAFGQLVVKGERHYHLARIIVSPSRRRQGLGEALCRRLLDEARQRRAERVTLNVFSDNGAAVDLYRRLGFTECGSADSRGIRPMQLRQFAANVDNDLP